MTNTASTGSMVSNMRRPNSNSVSTGRRRVPVILAVSPERILVKVRIFPTSSRVCLEVEQELGLERVPADQLQGNSGDRILLRNFSFIFVMRRGPTNKPSTSMERKCGLPSRQESTTDRKSSWRDTGVRVITEDQMVTSILRSPLLKIRISKEMGTI